jgi:hypothetical protein
MFFNRVVLDLNGCVTFDFEYYTKKSLECFTYYDTSIQLPLISYRGHIFQSCFHDSFNVPKFLLFRIGTAKQIQLIFI